jgi:cbb3-type cytochrome oxidase maturation protein
MDILYLLIPISLIFVAIIAWVFIWSVKSGQYEDMEGPAHRILMDDDGIQSTQDDDEHSTDQSSASEEDQKN